MSEDCLYLNIFSLENDEDVTEDLPVLIWIHPGGLTIGHSTDSLWPRQFLIQETGLIIVSFQYRLNGFSNFPLDGTDVNLGFEDTRLAIKWVHDNIGEFGGDPNRITLFGQSGGAANALYQIVDNTLLDGQRLSNFGVKAVFLTSPAPTNGFDLDTQKTNAEFISGALGCINAAQRLDCMRAQPASAILGVMQQFQAIGKFVQTRGPGTQFEKRATNMFIEGKFDDKIEILVGNANSEGEGFLHVFFSLPEALPITTDFKVQFAVAVFSQIFGPVVNEDGTDFTPTFFGALLAVFYTDVVSVPGQIPQIIGFYGQLAQQQNISLWRAAGMAITDGTFRCPVDIIATSAAENTQVFRYTMTHGADNPTLYSGSSPISTTEATHGSDVAYIFGKSNAGFLPLQDNFSAREEAFSQRVMGFIGSMAKVKKPTNGPEADRWRRFESATSFQILELKPYEGQFLENFMSPNTDPSGRCAFWRPLLAP